MRTPLPELILKRDAVNIGASTVPEPVEGPPARGAKRRPMIQRIAIITAAAVALGAIALPANAQMRQQMADKAATAAANSFVSKIQGESCSQFAQTMAQMKNKSGSSSSGMSSKLKGNTEARTDFVNIVAAPLLNKMIDCNMMPGGM